MDETFTNDAIFEILKSNGDVDPSWIIDDVEPFINEICSSGMARNIGQNFTTIYLKLFDTVEKTQCHSCDSDIFMGKLEDKICPSCKVQF